MPLAWNRYGKARIRLVKLRRVLPAHELIDLTIDVQLEGAFDAVYVDGNNQSCLPTDTMKNSVYALARRDPIDHVETFAMRLAEHFAGKPAVSTVRIAASEHEWHRLDTAGRPDRHAFIQAGREEWTTDVVRSNQGTRITSGLRNLIVLKTSHSRFEGFPRDEYTTLEATDDRILATSVTAAWRYREGIVDFAVRERIRQALVATFAAHDSRSIQHTLYAMGEAALAVCNDVSEVTLSLPNRHHLLVNLAPFGLDNPNDVFVATDEPYGLIEATVRRSE
jgi:urate oxidase